LEGQNARTRNRFKAEQAVDVGKLIYDQPNKVDVFVGIQYWLNKFGNVERVNFKGTEEKSFLAGVAFHIF
jgi:hypothetical protein